ncbi:hypothetical protein ThvES_00004060 [Thiovulum sp. ES]|nr:hypothetical protein ThvES_00004060 [Thiovulum sp. ES]
MPLLFVFDRHPNDLTTLNVVEYADNLEEAIQEFEESREGVSSAVSEATSLLTEELQKEEAEVREASKSWEVSWEKAKEEFSILEKDFSVVGSDSKSYFAKLEEIANSINNPELKETEIKKNNELKDSWTVAYKNASKTISSLRELISYGDDFQKVLLGASLRIKIQSSITELEKISQQAKTLLTQLEELSKEGKKLISN